MMTWTTQDGTVLTEADTDRMAVAFEDDDYGLDDAERRPVGRPSLEQGASPKIAVRLGLDTRKRLIQRAADEDKRISVVVREAVEAYLAQG